MVRFFFSRLPYFALTPFILFLYSSKDAVVRVWDRKTLQLHRTLRGHEGPVNAVGLQSGKVVRMTVTEPFVRTSLTRVVSRSAQVAMER